jgi:hypothetical protein
MMSLHLDNWHSNGDKLGSSVSAGLSFLSFDPAMNHRFKVIRGCQLTVLVNSALDSVVVTLGLKC